MFSTDIFHMSVAFCFCAVQSIIIHCFFYYGYFIIVQELRSIYSLQQIKTSPTFFGQLITQHLISQVTYIKGIFTGLS